MSWPDAERGEMSDEHKQEEKEGERATGMHSTPTGAVAIMLARLDDFIYHVDLRVLAFSSDGERT